jgi:hypothetical protein
VGMMMRPPGMGPVVGPGPQMIVMAAPGMMGPMPGMMLSAQAPGRPMMSASGAGRGRGAGGGGVARLSSKPGTNFSEQQEAAGVRIDVRSVGSFARPTRGRALEFSYHLQCLFDPCVARVVHKVAEGLPS